ncbi:MAG: NADH-quinone oxidoreductase subunit NuoI [Campylobacter sp.]|nr:NADH-quinone oxidoreductase subunit NuoI [Campylobacter sp.]
MSYKFVDKREDVSTKSKLFARFVKRSLKGELFVGLWVVLREMLFGKSHTLMYPMEKMQLSPRYRAVHKLMKFVESENERCIGCGLCEKICVSNCISMQTKVSEDGHKVVENYSINLGRCVYCGFCADVCPELAIVHTDEYELACEQRAYFGFKNDLLSKDVKTQTEFDGFGSLHKNADDFIKKTPNAYEISAQNEQEGAKNESK